MTSLHAYFLLRNQQAFQRVLDAPSRSQSSQAISSSGGKSWTRPSPLSSAASVCDVNARDWLGRTVLHIAASATDASAPEYVRMLLALPGINVNLQDRESHWTALHRALYHGNLASALLLLQRAEIDLSLKDLEGYTAFDLYNSTVEGTKPSANEHKFCADLYTWGANRNAALGLGDGDDRTFPDQVVIEPAQPHSQSALLQERFSPIRVKQIVMSKLHTGVVTTESRANLRMCGFSSGGRLGPGQHTQYQLTPVPQFTHTIVSVALGQDHTLALTQNGEVLTWGLNRFSQLGYIVDTLSGAVLKAEEPIQTTARKVGGLRGKPVRGVAACKTASACWTDEEVYTWGTNNGQLGYDKTAHPVQILPRVVTKIPQPALSVTITDNALVCLLHSQDVVCLYNNSLFRVNFPTYAFPSEIAPYRPPQATRVASIDKITSCDSMIAALSSNGELFTFSLPPVAITGSVEKPREIVKPQRVWALRKKFSAVKDVALGADGSIIICTESGHVFVRSRTGGKTFKFQRVPYMQRVVKVSANSTGAYGALCVDAVPEPLEITGNLLAQDLGLIQPYRGLLTPKDRFIDAVSAKDNSKADPSLELNDEDDASILHDREELLRLCRLLSQHKTAVKGGLPKGSCVFNDDATYQHGADLIIHVQAGSEPKIPVHKLIVAARCPVLGEILAGRRILEYRTPTAESSTHLTFKLNCAKSSQQSHSTAPWKDPARLVISGCHPITVLILLEYLYSDALLALWDWRVAQVLEPYFLGLKIRPAQVKAELQRCAQALELPTAAAALQAAFKAEVAPTVVQQFARVVASHDLRDPLHADVTLALFDKEVSCHSSVLRARSPLFKAFFDDDDWTKNRWSDEGTLKVNLRHLAWRPMRYVMQYLYGGDIEMFETLDFISSVEELLEFMFEVMAAANELLLDRLVLICSSVILKRVNVSNVCSILSEATYYNALPLVRSLQGYIAQIMETLLESKMLDDLSADLIKQLSASVRQAQARKSPLSRSNSLANAAMEKYSEWLSLQDIPQPIVPSMRPIVPRDTAKLSPSAISRKQRSPQASPIIRPQISSRPTAVPDIADDELFMMDNMDGVPPLELALSQAPSKRPSLADLTSKASSGWKVSSVPRVDMKAIMAEAETSKAPITKSVAPLPAARIPSIPSEATNATTWRSPQRSEKPLPASTTNRPPANSPSGPWRSSAAIPSSAAPVLAPAPQATLAVRSPPVKDKPAEVSGLKTSSAVGPGGSSQPSTPQKPGMGPMFSPSKQAATQSSTSSPGSSRRISGPSAAWTLPPVQPVVQSSKSTSGISLVAIQQMQLEQDAPMKKDKRSLKEIQEEEQARQVEEDFLIWWAAEEERLKLEQTTPTTPSKRPQNKGKKGGKPGRANEEKDGGTPSPSRRRPLKRPPCGPKGNNTSQKNEPAS
ncbi:hypothetical protein PHLCEN_2v11910 [Hermanssonia centrifuga]|uniref:BTB domain-containing protein n=1 Tax=Hermanssonia centrifuga TaxID=98765 RepID=A0A2R6NIP3_9APHY|nr:hypothetical protein PHLCEN_2v11910 [Hermanssonia centrifuga]